MQTAVPEKARRPESSSHPKIVFWRIWAIRKSGKSPRTLISQRKRLICIYTLPLQTETQEFLSSVLADLCKSPPVRIPHHRSAPGNETIFGLQIAASFGKIQPKQSGFARDRADSVRIMRIEQRQKKNDALLAERIIQMAEIKPLMYGKGGADEKCIVTAYETGNLMCEVCRAVSSPDDWAINSFN